MSLYQPLDRRHAIQRIGACCGGLFGLGMLGGCESTDVTSRAPSQLLLMDTDEAGLWKIMEKVERDLAVSPRRIRDAALEEYVNGIVCRVAGDHCGDLRVYLVKAPFFNASMAPNGMMQVWTGALLRIENEAQLASVVAHEAGHFIERHTLENFRRLKNNATAAMFFGMGIVMRWRIRSRSSVTTVSTASHSQTPQRGSVAGSSCLARSSRAFSRKVSARTPGKGCAR